MILFPAQHMQSVVITSSARPNPLRQSIDLTTRTIDRRTFHFRNTVVAVVIVSVAAIATALVIRSWRPLTAFFLLPTVISAFILIDTVIVTFWRRMILASWSKGAIDFNHYTQTIAMMKALPRATIDGMLRLLPIRCDYIDKKNTGLRSAMEAITGILASTMMLRGAASAAIAFFLPVSIAATLVSLNPLYLLGTCPVVPIFLLSKGIEWMLWRRIHRETARRFTMERLDRDELVKAASLLDWDPVGEKKKQRFLGSFGAE